MYIKEPKIIKPIDWLFSIVERRIGHKMMPARLLLWYPKAFISSMVLEGLIVHQDKNISKRMLKLIRMQVSMAIACPFCIDMNSHEFEKYHITKEEIKGMQGLIPIKNIATFSYAEKLVLYYAKYLVTTPIMMPQTLVVKMKRYFSDRQYTIIVTTIAQVAYWTRIIQGFGIKPAGFLEQCELDYFK